MRPALLETLGTSPILCWTLGFVVVAVLVVVVERLVDLGYRRLLRDRRRGR